MRPFQPPHPNRNQPHRVRPGGDLSPPFPSIPMHPSFPPPVPNLAAAAANPMAAAAAANPYLALQLLGQAQQFQNLGFLAAAALQQQQPPPFFPRGFSPNPNQFAPYLASQAGFNGGAGVCGPRPPRPMMNPAGKGYNTGGAPPAPRPMLNAGLKDWNRSGRNNGEVENKADGISDFSFESGGRNKLSDQKGQFNSGRDGKDSRQFGSTRGRGRGRNFNPGRARGSNNWRETNSNHRSHESPALEGRRKRPPIIYDANEVKQWLEARKKNYPTSINISKKLSQNQSDEQNKDEGVQMRRQELKEVLAKQQELGFELPELPPGYLSENEDVGNERRSKWKTQRRDSHFGNHSSNTKRPRFDRGDSRSKRSKFDRGDSRSKKPKVRNNTSRDDNTLPKSREPTLLQKLLNSDIKRDRHRLLHTFKFMVMNNFFKDWPDKPLEFPSVMVNEIEVGNHIPAGDLDDLQNAEMIKNSSLDLKENGDGKELTSIDGEIGSVDHSEEESEDGASAESSDEHGNESASEEHCDESEDDAT